MSLDQLHLQVYSSEFSNSPESNVGLSYFDLDLGLGLVIYRQVNISIEVRN